MKKAGFWILAMVFVLNSPAFGADCLSAFKQEHGNLAIAGGTAHIPVVKEAARRIMTYNKDIRITIGGGGSGVGIKKVGEGLIDIGNSGRKPTDNEIERYGLTMYRWAVDGVAVVVNPAREIRNLNTKILEKLFSGDIQNWKEVGGNDAPVNVYTRDASSGTRKVFWKKALSKGEITGNANFVSSNGAMKTAVANDVNSIGYISMGHIDGTVKGVALNGTAPTLENVKSGKYAVARGLYSNTKGKAVGLAEKFIDYLYSTDGQAIISAKGFIPVGQ
ncbi:MAG: phosphate ABC transporter substrate-binding protein [Desulfobacteraceae bacterium]